MKGVVDGDLKIAIFGTFFITVIYSRIDWEELKFWIWSELDKNWWSYWYSRLVSLKMYIGTLTGLQYIIIIFMTYVCRAHGSPLVLKYINIK